MKNMEKGQAGFQKKIGSEIKTIKDDIEYLKKKSSKAIVRKRIALAVFIAVIVCRDICTFINIILIIYNE